MELKLGTIYGLPDIFLKESEKNSELTSITILNQSKGIGMDLEHTQISQIKEQEKLEDINISSMRSFLSWILHMLKSLIYMVQIMIRD